MTQINVAGQKYTDAQPMQSELLTVCRLIAELRRDLDGTAKIQGDILKREIGDQSREIAMAEFQMMKKDIAYIKNRLSPTEKAVRSASEIPPEWQFLTEKYT